MEEKGKVFGIGLSRTGTSSLANALEILGYRAIHAESLYDIETHEAATDTPVAAHYRELDQRYPNSKFILTLRDMDEWLESCQKHWYSLYDNPRDVTRAIEYSFCRGALYGIEGYDRGIFRAAYDRHVRDVREHFRDRPDDLLEMDICAGDGFEKLCAFLGKPHPGVPFPRLNTAEQRDSAGGRVPYYRHYDVAAKLYRAGEVELAKHRLHMALEAYPSLATDKKRLLDWVVATSCCAEHEAPCRSLDPIFDNLPAEARTLSKLRRRACGQCHAAIVFLAAEHNDRSRVRRHLLPALVNDPAMILNRGFLSIMVRSLFGPARVSA